VAGRSKRPVRVLRPRWSYPDITRALTETLEQHAATSEILHAISSSPTDLEPVFQTIAQRAKRLCNARECGVFRFDGTLIHLVAQADTSASWAIALRRAFPRPPGRGSITARAVLTRSVVHVPDVLADPDYDLVEASRSEGIRSVLSVPILRDGGVVGVITVDRREPRPFLETQIRLLKTFAAQAVIAIENVRLFKELEARNHDLTEALDQQTATSEVLKVISRSVFDLQAVLDTLIENATRLAVAEGGLLARFDGEVFRILAGYGASPEVREYWQRNVIRPGRGAPIGRAAIERQTIHIVDLLADPEYELHEAQRVHGGRSVLVVPMLRQDDLLGVIFMYRTEVRPFTDKQIDLVATFADQAVIAIENVRLFTELQEKNRALTRAHAQVSESLEQQTGTSEILRVISASPTDTQPVFDAIAQSAMRLCSGNFCNVLRYDDDLLQLAAQAHITAEGVEALERMFPMRPSRATVAGRVVLETTVIHLPDVQQDVEFDQPLAAALRARSALGVPMLRDGQPIGAIVVGRSEPQPFAQTN
jgi:two-component system, NtrC family, sensor kinase